MVDVKRVGAGLALAVALGLAVTACGIPTGSAPTMIPRSNVPFGLLGPSGPPTVGSTVPNAVSVPEIIYLVAPDQHVVAVSRDLEEPATLSDILGALLEGPTAAESSTGIQTFLAGTKTQVSATVTNGVATVDFTADPVQVVGPNQTLAIAQLVYTATQQTGGPTRVLFQIAGSPIGVPTASGAQVLGPVDRTMYAPQAPPP